MSTNEEKGVIEASKSHLDTVFELMQHVPVLADLIKEINRELIEYAYDSDYIGYGDEYTQVYVTIKIAASAFMSLKANHDKNEVEKLLLELFNDCVAEQNVWGYNTVRIVPIGGQNSSVSKGAINVQPKVWKSGYLRAFISHLSESKDSAGNLSDRLFEFGIHGFVAHEDISVTQDWEKTLTDAIFSCDFLIAIYEKGFLESTWCDQEVGMAIGRSKEILPIIRTTNSNLHGFMGKYQGIRATSHVKEVRTIARRIAEAMIDNENTRSKYVNIMVDLILRNADVAKAKSQIEILSRGTLQSKDKIMYLRENIGEHSLINNQEFVRAVNELFTKFGIEQYTKQVVAELDDSLPF